MAKSTARPATLCNDEAAELARITGFRVPARAPNAGFSAECNTDGYLEALQVAAMAVLMFRRAGWQESVVHDHDLSYQMVKGGSFMTVSVSRHGVELYCEEI